MIGDDPEGTGVNWGEARGKKVEAGKDHGGAGKDMVGTGEELLVPYGSKQYLVGPTADSNLPIAI